MLGVRVRVCVCGRGGDGHPCKKDDSARRTI